jgi:uracil-DNA glycosylase
MVRRKADFPKLESSWKQVLEEELEKPYFKKIKRFLHDEIKRREIIYPPIYQVFNAFSFCPLESLKVVIVGQDPYHNPGQAHGLCFSVSEGEKRPPSLVNIFKELFADLQIPIRKNGNLEGWARQGVFLINSSLTVRENEPASHSKIGWNFFTDSVIKAISSLRENIVFLLWGNHAGLKRDLIDSSKHLILTAPHPSPLSAHSGFFGCKHFSRTNEYLKQNKIITIDWSK